MKHSTKIREVRSKWYKSMDSAVSVDEESNKIFGYLAGFGNVDSDGDLIIKGAFSKSIDERGPESSTARKIAFLYMHDMKIPVGKFTKLQEKDQGLYYEANLDLVPFVTDTVKPQLKSGTLNQHSIGFNYVYDKMQYDEEKDCFVCKEIDLFEGSIVTLGANENTPFGGFKSYFDKSEHYNELAFKANRLLQKMGNPESEFELRSIIQSYQSLLSSAADEITAFKKQPTKFDMDYVINNFKL